MNRQAKIYLGTAFIWTWSCWIGAYLFDRGIDIGAGIFSIDGSTPLAQIIFMIGVFGPLLGFVVASHDWKLLVPKSLELRMLLLVLVVPLLVALPGLVLSLVTLKMASGFTVSAVIIYFFSNLVTSGTEEIGWRGFLYNYLKGVEKNFWDISWKGGLIWAVWHYPLMVIMYLPHGPFVLIPSLIGFTAGIVAMNYISNYLYEKSGSIHLMMVFHALNNTFGFLVLLLYPTNPYVILTHLTAWIVVAILDKKESRRQKENAQ